MSELRFTVPLVPPGVNHYVRHTRRGGHYLNKDATAFKDAVAIFNRGGFVQGKVFYVRLDITLGAGDKGDVDNFPKLPLDGLAKAAVFRNKKGEILSDAKVSHLEVVVDRRTRPEAGWTVITVRAEG